MKNYLFILLYFKILYYFPMFEERKKRVFIRGKKKEKKKVEPMQLVPTLLNNEFNLQKRIKN